MLSNEDLDIMGTIKQIENYKNFLLSTVADLFVTMGKGSKGTMDEINDELSEIIIFAYLLGRKLGLDFNNVDERLLRKLKLGMLEEDSNSDYSKLIAYIKNGREV